MKYAPLLLLCFLFACSPQKRLNRLIAKHPELVTHDTIVVNDTIMVDRVEAHTVEILMPGDTLYVDRDRLHVKVVKMPGDSIYVQGICDADTIYREVKVPCDTVQPVKEVQVTGWKMWALVFVLAFVAFMLALDKMFRK